MGGELSVVDSDPVRVTLNLVHDFELWCNETLVSLPPSSQRLVGYVALHDRPVRRARASSTLWLDSPEERASASLRSALWRVPAPAGVTVLASSGTHLWLNPTIAVDFRGAIARAHSLTDGYDFDTAAIDVARELCCFSGDLLTGWYDDWVVMERERFHHLRLQALDQLGERLYVHGRLGDALQVGLATVHAEPLRESAHRLVTKVHLEQGNVAEAVRQYRAYEHLLANELGAAPSPAMMALVDSYLRPLRLSAE